MFAFKLLRDLLNGSGWTSLLTISGITRSGIADSFLKVTHVARTRLAHKVTAASLYILQQRSFEQREDKKDAFETWTKKQTLE